MERRNPLLFGSEVTAPGGRILIPVTCAWTVRNLLLSGVADGLARTCGVVFALPPGRDAGGLFSGWDTVELPDLDRSGRRHGHIRQRMGRAHLWVASETVARSLLYLYRRNASPAERLRVTANSWRARLESHPKLYRRLVEEERRRWFEINRDSRPDAERLLAGFNVVVFPAPHSSRERWLARWAKELGVRTVAIVHSFDNPTTTSRHFINYDRYLVWNARMRSELLRIYPEVSYDAVLAAGTPHFSFYFAPDMYESRAAMARRFELDPDRPILVYAGGPKALVPHEVQLVARLVEDLREYPERARPQLIVRPHPIERDPARWDLLRAFPEVRWSEPGTRTPEDAEWTIPTREELRQFCSLVRNSDVMINSCSTMSIDAALCDTPVICLNYALPPYEDFEPYMRRYYRWDHYRPVVASGGVRLANGPRELVELIGMYLAGPSLDRAKRAALARDMCGDRPDEAVERYTHAILAEAAICATRT